MSLTVEVVRIEPTGQPFENDVVADLERHASPVRELASNEPRDTIPAGTIPRLRIVRRAPDADPDPFRFASLIRLHDR